MTKEIYQDLLPLPKASVLTSRKKQINLLNIARLEENHIKMPQQMLHMNKKKKRKEKR